MIKTQEIFITWEGGENLFAYKVEYLNETSIDCLEKRQEIIHVRRNLRVIFDLGDNCVG